MSQLQTGWGALLGGRNSIRSIALAGGVGLHAVNVYLVTTILPSVVADIGGLDYYAWNTTLFVVASIVGSATSVRLLETSGPRLAYVVAAFVFGLGTVACALALTMPMMLAGRFIQGLGGGLLVALSYSMIRLVFPESLWPRAMALVSGMWGVATLVGPAVGGVFAELGHWRAAFWTMVPVIALFALLAFGVLPKRDREADGARGKRPALPVAQLFLLSLAVAAVSVGSIAPDPLSNLAGVAAALLLLFVLMGVERTAKQRLLPRGSFSLNAALGPVFLSMMMLAVTVTGSEIFVPLFLQVLHAQQPLMAGYLAALMGAGWTMGSIWSSGVQGHRVGRNIRLAPAVVLAGMASLAVLVPGTSIGTWQTLAPICVALLVAGAGVGIGWPHLLTRVLQVAPADEQGLASAAITTVQLFATALGAALAGMVANMAGLIDPGGVPGTSATAMWLFAVFAMAPAIGLFSAARVARAR
ncbi:MFS transporter [Ottowia sp. VDI28]|uniref:MFS transporter n=1 Tax=Ottowia sp. VDI28 TaxID=3133968 RepID=UPI003C30D617